MEARAACYALLALTRDPPLRRLWRCERARAIRLLRVLRVRAASAGEAAWLAGVLDDVVAAALELADGPEGFEEEWSFPTWVEVAA